MEQLEDRLAPATFTDAAPILTLDLAANDAVAIVANATSYSLALISGTWSGIDDANVTGNGTANLSVTAAAFNQLNITDSGADAMVTFNDSGANLYAADFTVTLDSASAGIFFSGNSSFGDFDLNANTDRNIDVSGGITTVHGNISLLANQQAAPTSGNFIGINEEGAGTISSTTGDITLKGRGGNDNTGVGEVGVLVQGSVGTGTSGQVSLTGTGGNANGDYNHGVSVTGSSAVVTSNGGAVSVTGQGGGFRSNGFGTVGVDVEDGGQITVGGSGTVTVQGTGGSASGPYNYGVYVAGGGALISSGGGPVSVTGQGGGWGISRSNRGVELLDGGQISAGGSGTVTVEGTGGRSSSVGSDGGVGMNGGAIISSNGGAVSVTGQGGRDPEGASGANVGVDVEGGSQITAGGDGTVTVEGHGGFGIGPFNNGVYLSSGGAVTSSGGAVSVTGAGGGRSDSTGSGRHSSNNYGVELVDGCQISAGGGGTVTVVGGGGAGIDGRNFGVYMTMFQNGTPPMITSSGGDVLVIGGGGQSDDAVSNYGVYAVGGQISAGGAGTVTVQGDGGSGSGDEEGVDLQFTKVTSSGGAVSVTGRGGLDSSGGVNFGVALFNGCQITAGGNGAVSVRGNAGGNYGNYIDYANYGVLVSGNVGGVATTITSGGGSVAVTGEGGGYGLGLNSHGVVVNGGGQITAGGTGTVSVQGTGGFGDFVDGFNYGVEVEGIASTITSSGGAVSVTGQGGGDYRSAGGSNYGVYVVDGGKITAGGSATVTVQGTGGSGTGGDNQGVLVSGVGSAMTSSGGDVQVIGMAGSDANSLAIRVLSSGAISTPLAGGNITLIGDSMDIIAPAVINAGANTVTLKPKTTDGSVGISLGGADAPGTLGLTDAELDQVTANTLTIGDPNSGTIALVAPITRIAATNVNLATGGDIVFNPGSFNTAGGALNLSPGNTGALQPITSGADVNMSSVTLGFSSGADLAIVINGTTVDTEYSQLNVVGAVNLTGVDLVLSGTHVPVPGETYTIVNNDGSDPIIGAFTGLLEGATIANFLGSGQDATISYVGGANHNDAVVVVGNPVDSTTTVTGGTFTYDGGSHGAVASAVTGGGGLYTTASSFSYAGTGNTSYGPTATAPTNAGAYTVTATYDGDATHTGSTSRPAAIIINKAPVSRTIGNAAHVYGSTVDLAAALGTTINTGVNGETLAIAYNSAGNTVTANAGTYDITGVVSDGAGLASNYTVTLTPGTLKVSHATLTGDATTQNALNMAKQGKLTITVSNVSGLLNGDTLAALLNTASYYITIGTTKYEFVPTTMTTSGSNITITYTLKNSALMAELGHALDAATSGATAVIVGFEMDFANYTFFDSYLTNLFSTIK